MSQAPNTAEDEDKYVVYMPFDSTAGTTRIRVKRNADVIDLEELIFKDRKFKDELVNDRLILYKCDDLQDLRRNTDAKTRYDAALVWLRNNAQIRNRMDDGAELLRNIFPTGPADPGSYRIDVLAVNNAILEGPDVLYALPDMRASKVVRGRLSQINFIRQNFPPPSEGVTSEEKIKLWVNEDGIVHPHRPAGNYGPPTALFHPALARLRHNLKHLDQVEEPDSEYFEWAHKFLVVSSNGFNKEKLREGELKSIIDYLVESQGTWQVWLEDKAAKPDAVWGEVIRMILELKNLDGVGGNASLQALLVYAKVLAQPKYEKLLTQSNYPVVLIGIMGSRLEISSAVYSDGIFFDKLLSEDLCIDAWQSETVLRVGRIFKALSIANKELRDFYAQYHGGQENAKAIAQMYPNPLPCGDIRLPRLNYLGKLSHTGELLVKHNKQERPYALYRAKMKRDDSDEEIDVVVKFTVRYHEEAHRMLAEEQLAPTLHFCIPLVGDMYMVVMDYVEGVSLYCYETAGDYEGIYRDVERAVSLLHGRDLVFGDLRAQNIIVKPGGGALLIDFDWVGEHQVDRYPASWNNDGRWAPDVERRGLMDKEHDNVMLNRMRGD